MWDLQRNGGSVNATTERILARGSLDAVGFLENQWFCCQGLEHVLTLFFFCLGVGLATAVVSAHHHTYYHWRDARDRQYDSGTGHVGARRSHNAV